MLRSSPRNFFIKFGQQVMKLTCRDFAKFLIRNECNTTDLQLHEVALLAYALSSTLYTTLYLDKSALKYY